MVRSGWGTPRPDPRTGPGRSARRWPAHGGDAAAQELLGHGDLLGAQLGQGGVAMGGHRSRAGGAVALAAAVRRVRARRRRPLAVAIRRRSRPAARGRARAALRRVGRGRPVRAAGVGRRAAVVRPGAVGRRRAVRRGRRRPGAHRGRSPVAPGPGDRRRGRRRRVAGAVRRRRRRAADGCRGRGSTDTPLDLVATRSDDLDPCGPPPLCSSALGAWTEITVMPSSSKSASARRTSPTLATGGTSRRRASPAAGGPPGRATSTMPSSRRLVSSISIRRDIRATTLPPTVAV